MAEEKKKGGAGPGKGGPSKGAKGRKGPGEFQSSDQVRTGLIPGRTFASKPVQYSVVDGMAIFEGDIILGTVEEVERRSERLRAEQTGELAAGVVITGEQFRWPDCRIPYTIDPTLPNQARVTDAIAHWEAMTSYQFVLRTTETDYVTFRPSTGCSSSVGRQGGQQFLNLASGCTTGNAIHEIGHTVGLWHEQSREDRDSFVTIHWDKIEPGREHNFNQHIVDGDDVGPYDYGSIMHYPRNAFSIDGSDTITPLDPTAEIGQRDGLSAGDIAAASSLCPTPPKPVPFDTRKEVVKDLHLDTKKELISDTLKEMLKDRIKEVALDPPWGKVAGLDWRGPIWRWLWRQGGQGPGPGRAPTGPLPFAMATPHRAPAGMADQPDEATATAATLDAQLQMLAEQLTELEATRQALQAQYDEIAELLRKTVEEHDSQP